MSNKKKPKAGFQERTTAMTGEGVTISRMGGPQIPTLTKHYVGADHAPTEAEALEMGRALYDAIVTEQAAKAREESSSPS